MDKKNKIIEYSLYGAVAVFVIGILVQWHMFATPAQVEEKHRLIMAAIQEKYVTKEDYKNQKEELKDMKTKIDKIYDLLINQKR